ncbi:MAG: bacillithiol biosynthesis cysteine-adding enzyme BshC, partial [Lutibacter sp.]|nr:bacillithiol biosynthesis cysteine-adding enzyme BshC [Lutibacter sp.]
SVVTAIGLDHTDWLPENERTIDKIIFEKTSSLLKSNIIISKQTSRYILDKVKSSIKENKSKKIIFNDHYNYYTNENNFFDYEDAKLVWDRAASGAVGRLSTAGLEKVWEVFVAQLPPSTAAKELKDLFQKAYLEHETLAAANRYLINALFGAYGLVILDGDDRNLKALMRPVIEKELLEKTCFTAVSKTNKLLKDRYKIQVNPRETNLFYLKDGLRERLILAGDHYQVNRTDQVFSKEALLQELSDFPERFSPNVLMRPLYQERILPNLAYIGGAGEISYWLQLKACFKAFQTPFPLLVLRNSVLMVAEKQQRKLQRLNIDFPSLFLDQERLVAMTVKDLSDISLDLSVQRRAVQAVFKDLKRLATKTDPSFTGAVNAQEKRQLNGLDTLEKRLLKAQKRKLSGEVKRIRDLHQVLFPNGKLQERYRNFTTYYLEMGDGLIPELMCHLDPFSNTHTLLAY